MINKCKNKTRAFFVESKTKRFYKNNGGNNNYFHYLGIISKKKPKEKNNWKAIETQN